MFGGRTRSWFSLAILVVLAVLFSGCLWFGPFSVVGTVTEEGTGVTLPGVVVELGGKTTTTNALGQYSLPKVRRGASTLKITLDGYQTFEQSVNLKKNETIDVILETDAELLGENGFTLWDEGEEVRDGDTIESLMIEVVGDALESFGEGGVFSQAQIIVNGQIYEVMIDGDNAFAKDIPLNPGENSIQIRVWDANGHARTSPRMTVTVNVPRLDMRIVLAWDTPETDLDLHLFKRLPTEGNVFLLYTDGEYDRHVCYYNEAPTDFAVDTENPNQNPFLDIDETDGFGPETIVLKEITPGDYHIWIHPYDLEGYPMTKATLKVILDGTTADVREETYVVDLPEDLHYHTPVYVITVRVTDTTKTFVELESSFVPID